MVKVKQEKKGKEQGQTDYTWLWVILGVVLIVVFFVWQSQSPRVFTFLEGDEGSILVLLNSKKDVSYKLQYIGREPVTISQIQLKLIAGKELKVYTDVEEMKLLGAGMEVVLEKVGTVPAGEVFLLQPQDEFEIIITLSGADLGTNRLENIIIHYLQGDREVMFELPLNETYFNVE